MIGKLWNGRLDIEKEKEKNYIDSDYKIRVEHGKYSLYMNATRILREVTLSEIKEYIEAD